jgi:hypothetical protein
MVVVVPHSTGQKCLHSVSSQTEQHRRAHSICNFEYIYIYIYEYSISLFFLLLCNLRTVVEWHRQHDTLGDASGEQMLRLM